MISEENALKEQAKKLVDTYYRKAQESASTQITPWKMKCLGGLMTEVIKSDPVDRLKLTEFIGDEFLERNDYTKAVLFYRRARPEKHNEVLDELLSNLSDREAKEALRELIEISTKIVDT